MISKIQNITIGKNFNSQKTQKKNHSKRATSYSVDSVSFKAINPEEFIAPRAALITKLEEQFKQHAHNPHIVKNDKGTILGSYINFIQRIERPSCNNPNHQIFVEKDGLGARISILNPEKKSIKEYFLIEDGNVACFPRDAEGNVNSKPYELHDEAEGASLLKEIKVLLETL